MADEFSQYDGARRRGIFDKCNGRAPAFIRDEDDAFISAYFDGYDTNEVKIGEPQPEELEIEFEPETVIHFAYTECFGEVEGMFDNEGKLLGIWSNNDAHWRQEYFGPFLEELNIRVETHYSTDDEWEDKIKNAAKEHWGLSDWDE